MSKTRGTLEQIREQVADLLLEMDAQEHREAGPQQHPDASSPEHAPRNDRPHIVRRTRHYRPGSE